MKTLKHCTECDTLFSGFIHIELCTSCMDKEDALLREVTRFIRKQKGRVDKRVVMQLFNLPESKIDKWVDNNRIQVSSFAEYSSKCRLCGDEATNGFLCNECADDFKTHVQNSVNGRELPIHHTQYNTFFTKRDK